VEKLKQRRNQIKNEINKTSITTKIDTLRQLKSNISSKLTDLEAQAAEAEAIEMAEQLESVKNDSSRYHKLIRIMNKRRTHTSKLIVHDAAGNSQLDADKQCELVTNWFKDLFNEAQPIRLIMPNVKTPMTTPFTGEEIKGAIQSLRNNSSPGSDNLDALIWKNCPFVVFDIIAGIFNDINLGVLIPLHKPGKKRDLLRTCDR